MKPELTPEVRSIVRAQLSRRRFIAGAGAVSGATLLAACSSKDAEKESGSADATASAPVDEGGTVRWANWPGYLDFDSDKKTYTSLETFKAASGINVVYKEDVNDNDEFYGKVQGQLKLGKDIGYDIVTLTDWMAGRWVRMGYTQAFDEANIPNKANILPSLANVGFDPGRKSTITWQSGFAGFGWNKEKIPGGIQSIEQLFDKKNKGRVEVLSEMRDTMGIILLSQGVDPSQPFTDDQFMNAIDFLEKKIADGFIRQVKGNDYLEDMVSGDAVAVIGWSGDLFSLSNENGGKFGFQVPESGGTLWSDNAMIPSTSKNKKNAETVLNNYYDPAIAAQVAAYVTYICPVVGAQAEMEKIDPELAKNPFIFPDEDALANVRVFRTLTPEEDTKYSEAFQAAAGN
jgi:spermidine/putrescine transport system substrate-binding protein